MRLELRVHTYTNHRYRGRGRALPDKSIYVPDCCLTHAPVQILTPRDGADITKQR